MKFRLLKQQWSSDFATIWMKFRLLSNNEVPILQQFG
jgi:hypothetical protein